MSVVRLAPDKSDLLSRYCTLGIHTINERREAFVYSFFERESLVRCYLPLLSWVFKEETI